ncbi:MAG: hypothetical protein U1E62_18515 [Alsobacter sp.]
MKHDFSAESIRRRIGALSQLELSRFDYCYRIGSTFVACSLLEDMVITAMLFCDRVHVSKVLGADAEAWQKISHKQQQLRDSTLGTLVSILARHGIAERDIAYLRWLKNKRDHFIHRFFHGGAWPGELDERQVEGMCRSLGAYEIIFRRGTSQIFPILGRAGLMRVEAVSEGLLAFNHSMFDEKS